MPVRKPANVTEAALTPSTADIVPVPQFVYTFAPVYAAIFRVRLRAVTCSDRWPLQKCAFAYPTNASMHPVR